MNPADKLPGFEIYINNCTVCHDMKVQVVGPALVDVHERMDSLSLRAWIRNSQALIESDDEYAVNLYEEYNRTMMPAFDFTDEQLTQLIDYLEAYSEAYVPEVIETRAEPEITAE
ncbi:cytochrome c [Roseivirga sp. BDSF3-8]|uniref:c-type cytochrome n=1 Tax=Roseivirga sp. BDSF3-8 TaxID=3241598 RepID=UPI0035327540